MTEAGTNHSIFVARQPIHDAQCQVVAYELLYRSDEHDTMAATDGDRATTEILINSVLDIGLERIVGRHRAYFNLTASFVRGDRPLPLDRDRVVLEILEDIEPDEEVVRGLRHLVDEGFTIALDDFVYSDRFIPLLELAHIVKLEVAGRTRDELHRIIERLRPHDVQLLAEKVETHEEFEICRALGFDYFQGYFFCRPSILEGRALPSNRLVILNLLAKLQDPEVGLEELEELIIQDVSLTYRLLRYINTAAFAQRREVRSVNWALRLIGVETIRNWASLLLMARIDDKPRELMRTALIRARMCTLIADLKGLGRDRDQCFTCGLFSVLDALMDCPMEELLADVPLNVAVQQALITRDGPFGAVLTESIRYEQGRWHELPADEVPVSDYRECYLDAISWADDSMRSLEHMA